jgi:hypothetical protein
MASPFLFLVVAVLAGVLSGAGMLESTAVDLARLLSIGSLLALKRYEVSER